ncbi:MAG: 4-alpha-glucanotransferase [Terriglobia bacterium]
MHFEEAIRTAAEKNGVQQQFWDIFGKSHYTTPETNRAILTSLGFDCSSEEGLRTSAESRDAANWQRLLPTVLVVGADAPPLIPVCSPASLETIDLEIAMESGEKHSLSIDLIAAAVRDKTAIDGVEFVERLVELPSKLPLGYHEVRAGSYSMRLIVGPDRAHTPVEGRHAGLAVTMWGLRSERNWGVGDFRDLRDLIDWAVPALHVDFIALNPLHATHNRAPYNTSPYLPNSIFYRNFLYLDVEGVEGFETIRPAFEAGGAEAEKARLRTTEFVEYEKAAALKRHALELIFESHPPNEACHEWIAQEGDLLRLFATYCALDEYLHGENPRLWVWTDWPMPFQDPSSGAVREFAHKHEREILFHGWLQWLIDQQLAEVQEHAHATGMNIGLYHDLALATDSCGSDLWAHRPFFVQGARVGSPPDDFSPTGQDWSFPPPNEHRHREDAYRLYIQSIRKTMRHGGALRIDHVMRLFRLYWIPEGCDATRGAYVRDRPEDLVRILALESVRNSSVVIGEDLGTVEDEVRQTLSDFGILSYRLLIFERNDRGFKAPSEYSGQALTSTSTHDLPTVTGFWTGEDIAARLRTGTIDQQAAQGQREQRGRDKQNLLDAVFQMNLLPPGYERDAARIPELTGELHYAIAGFLANTPCILWLVNQEDITREPLQQNMPGTTAEYPNWSRKMRWTIEELSTLQEAIDSVSMFRHWIERTGRQTRIS